LVLSIYLYCFRIFYYCFRISCICRPSK
jgi:hypothetical protein